MPGVATAQLLTYSEIVDVDLDTTNDVNFADVEDYGHRVVIDVNGYAINNYLGWQRAVGSARPSAKLNSASESAFKAAIEAALSDSFVDIDGVTGGLHFGTANFDTNTDTRKRSAAGVSANDIPMCFVLYKLYGSSAVATLDNIYNLQDAHGMLSNETVATAITESFKTNEAGALDSMFRDLLAADPHRFFDAAGIPMTGIFETNADVSGSGSWNITGNDIIEVKLKLVFQSKVSRRGVAGREHNLSSPENAAGAQENQQTVINPSDYFYIRLQMKAIEPPSAPTSLVATASNGQTSVSFVPGSNGGKAITNYQYSIDGGATYTAFSPAQTTSPVTITGLTNGTTYNIKLKAVNIIGVGDASSTITASPGTIPSAPTGLLATAGNGQVSISFTAGSNGGRAISNYQYSLNGGSTFTAFNPAQTTSPVTITGLTNGTSYAILLRAVNSIGAGTASSTINATPSTMPSPPTNLSAVASNGQVIISFITGSNGGSAITNYQYSIDNGATFTAFSPAQTTSPVTISGLTGSSYSIQLKAVNANGVSSASSTVSVALYSGGQAKVATRSGGALDSWWAWPLVTVDNSGNVYKYVSYGAALTIYNYSGSPTGGGEVPTTVYGTLTGSDSALIKYNSNGQVLWATRVTGSPGGISTDASGNVYLIGRAGGSSTIYNYASAPVNGGNVGISTYGTLTGSEGTAYIIKYNSSGSVQYATKITTGRFVLNSWIDVDSSGNAYVVCASREFGNITPFSFTGAPNTTGGTVNTSLYGTIQRTGTTNTIGCIVKFNSSGVVQWGTNFGAVATNDAANLGVSTDSSGNVYIASSFNTSSATIYAYSSAPVSQGNVGLTSWGTISGTGNGALVIKYNSSGTPLWAAKIESSAYDIYPYLVSTDASGNVYISNSTHGEFGGNNTFYSFTSAPGGGGAITNTVFGTTGTGYGTTWYVKYSSSGVVQWVNRSGWAGVFSSSMCDASGNLYVTHSYSAGVAPRPNPVLYDYTSVTSGTITLTQKAILQSILAGDVFLIKYNSNGAVLWATVIGGSFEERNSSLYVDTENNVWVTGLYSSNPVSIQNFSSMPALTSGNVALTTYGTLADVDPAAGRNIFLVKYQG